MITESSAEDGDWSLCFFTWFVIRSNKYALNLNGNHYFIKVTSILVLNTFTPFRPENRPIQAKSDISHRESKYLVYTP